jgi:hypothetical protein
VIEKLGEAIDRFNRTSLAGPEGGGSRRHFCEADILDKRIAAVVLDRHHDAWIVSPCFQTDGHSISAVQDRQNSRSDNEFSVRFRT